MATQVITYDSVDISEYMETWSETNNARINAVTVPNRHGALLTSAIVEDARQISNSGRIISPDGTAEGMRDLLKDLLELFGRKNKRLQLWDDRYLIATKANLTFAYVPGSAMRAVDFSLTFFCADPFMYNDATSGAFYNLTNGNTVVDITANIYKRSFTVTYEGDFLIYPLWAVVAGPTVPLTNITIRNLTIGRQFYYNGTVAVNKSLVVDSAFFTVENDGENDLTNWNGDFIWLVPGDNEIEIEGTPPATYSLNYYVRSYM